MAKTKGIQKPEKPQLAVDIAVFTIINGRLSILLIRRGAKPFKGQWALPGGRVNKNEPLEDAAARELEEETGLKNIYLEQLYTFGAPFRDPRGRVVTVAYFALIRKVSEIYADTDAQAADWFPISSAPLKHNVPDQKERTTKSRVKRLPKLAFDHSKIISYALKRLRWKLEYTNIASNLLPRYFTLSELQKIYEIILEKKLDKRNFRKKILSLGLIKSAVKKKKKVAYRPPQLWRFSSRKHLILAKRELVF